MSLIVKGKERKIMSWLSSLFRGNEEISEPVCVEAETDAESLAKGIQLLDSMYPSDQYEETQEKEFYCGICGWVKISQYREHLNAH
jgi:hypothetical protein